MVYNNLSQMSLFMGFVVGRGLVRASRWRTHAYRVQLDPIFQARRLPVVSNLRLHLLGEFLLLSGETPLIGIDVPRLQSLLAYLVLHHTAPQTRSHLAYLLWPDSTESQAHTTLRNVIHKLRQTLPDADTFLQAQRQGLQWQPNWRWTGDGLDLGPARAGSEEGGRAKNMIAARPALSEAVDPYRGDFLPNCYD